MKIVSCYSVKGGVGKTATAVNLACLAAKSGKRTLLIDLDPQGASSFYFRVKPTSKNLGARFFKAYASLVKNIKASDFENLDIIPASLSFRTFEATLGDMKKRKSRLKRMLRGFRKEYDLIVLDCPPTIGYLSESIFIASDVLLVPIIPTTLSERTFEQLIQFFYDKNMPLTKIVPFFSMAQTQKTLHKTTMQEMKKRRSVFLESIIPFSSVVEKMGQHKAPVELFAKSTHAHAAYVKLWDELSDKHL